MPQQCDSPSCLCKSVSTRLNGPVSFSEASLDRILSDYPIEFQKHVMLTNVRPMGPWMDYLGTIPRYFNPKEPNYYDSIVHDYILSRGEDIEQYKDYGVVPKRLGDSYIAAKRYDADPDPLSDETKKQYDTAFDWLEREFIDHIGGSKVRSYEEVQEWLRPDKSPGVPWTQKYQYKIDYWLGDHRGFYADYWERLGTDDYIHSLCSVTIKEEVRPIYKINSGQIRTIVAMDINHVTAHLQLFLHQNQRLVDTCGKHSMNLGQNFLLGGADSYVASMSVFGPDSVMELDGNKFDARKKRWQLMKVGDFRFRMLAPEYQTAANRVRVTNLYTELATSPLVMPDGHVFGRDGGNPSGQGCTTPDNGFMNYTDAAVLYQKTVPKEYHTYEYWKKFVKLCICGDDINLALHEFVRIFLTKERIEVAAKEIGMVYTFGADKLRSACDCSFLGHEFKLVKPPNLTYEMYVPVIDCKRMRSNMLVDNKEKTVAHTIIRACGLRNETFGCESCREWFASLLNYLRDKFAADSSPEIVEAWKNYLPDCVLWRLYTGRSNKVAQSGEPDISCATSARAVQIYNPSFDLFTSLSNSLLNYLPYIMAKTAAQRAARNRRRRAKAAKNKSMGNQKPNGISKRKRGNKNKNKNMRMKGPGPSSVKASTGRLGLSMSSGMKPGSANRRQKYCEEDEFIANVIGSTTTTSFNISNTIQVNPGLAASFPWLAGEASRYNEHEWEYLEYYFKRTNSEYLATAGKVLLYFDPDASDVAPTTKQQIEDSVYHNDGMPCDPIIRLPIDCNRVRRNLSRYVRTGPNPANTDIKTYDAGVLYCAVDSNNSAINGAVIGELRVRYRVKFTVPVLTQSDTVGGVVHFQGVTPTTANNFATVGLEAGGTPSLTGITIGVNTITFPANIPGNYKIDVVMYASTSVTTPNAGGGVGSAGATAGPKLFAVGGVDDNSSSAYSAASTSATYAMVSNIITVGQTGGVVTYTPSTITGGNGVDIFITSLPTTVLTVDEEEQLEINQLKARADAQDRKIDELVRLLTHTHSPITVDDEATSSSMESSIHIPKGLFDKFIGPRLAKA